MSTYYKFRCPNCAEAGGFFSRQMWGWGNCDIFENFKFHVAHVACGSLQTLSEHDEKYFDGEDELRWLERLAADEWLRDEVWPHANEWQDVAAGWETAHEKWRAHFEETLDRERAEATGPSHRGGNAVTSFSAGVCVFHGGFQGHACPRCARRLQTVRVWLAGVLERAAGVLR